MTSYLWLVALIAPAGVLVTWLVETIPSGTVADSVTSALWFFAIFVGVFAAIAAVGAVGAAPFTQLLGRRLERVRSRFVGMLAHAVLAGTLAAISMQLLLFAFEDDHFTWQYPLLLSASVGLAAAIGRWRLDTVEPAAPELPAQP